ncbi:hypothetical protein DXG03_002941 [Asterophora parasitica]|uniref:Uncharacterized protein n=1 Tax=Asterophora parasitica TaxID=117018 RepID=A0A9P7G2F9_9AGAR|nr:hypothetical protein DXG03_002941 [Asterophora parasitica]
MNILAPHIPRCEILNFHLTYTSSLPRICTDFQDIAPHLVSLSFVADVDYGLGQLTTNDTPSVPQFLFPKLYDLNIDGYNFVDLIRYMPLLLDASQFTGGRLRSIGINQYSPSAVNGGGPFSIYDVLETLEHLAETLLLASVDLDHERNSDDGTIIQDEATVWLWHRVTLTRLPPDLITELLYCLNTEVLTISNCSLNGVYSSDLDIKIVTLENIIAPGFGYALNNILPTCIGGELNISRCPGFDDIVLYMLGSQEDHSDDLCAHLLSDLKIKDCQGFSVTALRRMLQARIKFQDEQQNLFERSWLTVTLKNGPAMTDEERSWYEENFW